ncbi:MAG: peptidylprolyl isomerase [Candidatus Moranbacteria bacterium]|nr:peptidylprolyl isomerase [Candidatus Moranbacteria bacterium]
MKEKFGKVNSLTIVITAIIAIVAYLLVVGLLIYGLGISNPFTRWNTKFIPYPAAIINSRNIITVNKLEENLVVIRKFYERPDISQQGIRVDFSTPEGKKRLMIKKKNLLNQMVENKIVEMLAEKNGIKITDAEITKQLDAKLDEFGTAQEVKDNIVNFYGWSVEGFQEEVVKPEIYREALSEKIAAQDSTNLKAQEKIRQALDEINKKNDFGETAKKYSEGDSAKNSGDVGWFSAEQMLPEIAQVAFKLKKGEVSDIIESSLGFHIIKIEDTKNEEGKDKVRIRQIFVRGFSFPDWLQEQKKNTKISVPVKGVFWNKNAGAIQFNDKELSRFEENLINNSPDDISILF